MVTATGTQRGAGTSSGSSNECFERIEGNLISFNLAKSGWNENMIWTVFHRHGVALAEAADRTSALVWCETQLGASIGPFALCPAIEADLEDVGLSSDINQADVDLARSICAAIERDAIELTAPAVTYPTHPRLLH